MRLLLLVSLLLVFAFGLVMVFNTSSAEILDRSLDKNTHHALMRQIAFAVVGVLGAWGISHMGYASLLKLSPLLLVLFSLLLLCTFVPGVGQARNGAHRWIGMGPLTFQPSEFVKYLVLMVYIEWIARTSPSHLSWWGFCKILLPLAIPLILVMVEPDNGTAAVIGVSLVPLFFLSGVRFRYWMVPMACLVILGMCAAYHLPYVRGRLKVYLHPELDLKGKGHQPYQAKIATGSGKLWGKGPGGSLQKLTYLPEAQNDYIAAIFAEEFGFVGILLLLVLYMLSTFAGIAIAMRAATREGLYLAAGISCLIAFQAFINLGVVSGLLPSKGVNLPFFSQGGTSLVANIFGLTLLLDVGKDVISRPC